MILIIISMRFIHSLLSGVPLVGIIPSGKELGLKAVAAWRKKDGLISCRSCGLSFSVGGSQCDFQAVLAKMDLQTSFMEITAEASLSCLDREAGGGE